MSKRITLKESSVIHPKKRSFFDITVDDVVGTGASCIVYNAHYTDSMGFQRKIRIKECYPYSSTILRLGDRLTWIEKSSERKDKASFKVAYEQLNAIQNLDGLYNSTIHTFSLIEANNTLYSVMELNEGVTFENDPSRSLLDISKTMKALAEAVGKYHANGYLHLDIKPSNFLVLPETREIVILFDVDSAIRIDDIASGRTPITPSYSKEWAAPEQKQGRVSKLSPATDIYCIGAVLFDKLLGRNPTALDADILADWRLTGELFENINPRAINLLQNILKKCLVPNFKKRYQNTEDLVADLSEVIRVLDAGAPYVVTSVPSVVDGFVGRSEEIDSINELFSNGTKTVFIRGVGGIGKSELAKKYATISHPKYDAVIFLKYEGSLKSCLKKINIQNCSIEDGESKISILHSIFLQQRVLLVIDNFDIDAGEDALFETVIKLGADTLITTRVDQSVFCGSAVRQIDLGNLTKDNLVALFASEANLVIDDKNKSLIENIIDTVYSYTLLIPVIARQMKASGLSLEDLRLRLNDGLKSFADSEKVKIYKDEYLYRANTFEMVRQVFSTAGLSPSQKLTLCALSLLKGVKINKSLYRDMICGSKYTLDDLNSLIDLCWVQYDKISDEISLHPVIEEVTSLMLNPSVTDFPQLSSFINELINDEEICSETSWTHFEEDVLENKKLWLYSLVSSFSLSTLKDVLFVCKVFDYVVGVSPINSYTYIDIDFVSTLNDSIEHISPSTLIHIEDAYRIPRLRLLFSIDNLVRAGQLQMTEKWEKSMKEEIEKEFLLADSFAHQLPTEVEVKLAINTLCFNIYSIYYDYSRLVAEKITEKMTEYEDIWWKPHLNSLYDQEQTAILALLGYDWKMTKERVSDRFEVISHSLENPVIKSFRDRFFSGEDVNELISDIMKEESLSPNVKQGCVSTMLKEAFAPIFKADSIAEKQKLIDEYDWKRAVALNKAFKLLKKERTYALPRDVEGLVIISHILAKDNEYAERELNWYLESVKRCVIRETEKSKFMSFKNLSEATIDGNIYPGILIQMSKCNLTHLALKYLILVAKNIKSTLEATDSQMYDWYRSIRDFAEMAMEDPNAKIESVNAIFVEYSNICNKLVMGRFVTKR